MKNTLIELPPEFEGLDEDSFVEASSVEELAERTEITDSDRLGRLFLPGHRVGPYKILGYVASGGMGEVYAAEREVEGGKRLGPVALKVISPEFVDDWQIVARFKREAQISRAIRSRHVTRVYEFGESDEGHLYLAMELLRGEELFDRLCLRPVLDDDEVVDLTLQILAGLRAVHDAGFVHRDLKPENVYFARREDDHEIIKILDFGIAKSADEESDPYLSVVGQIYGTPQYIAPEQGLNPDVDHRADLYSVGVLMYEALAGMLPFDGETAYATILAHQNEEVPALPSTVDPGLAEVVYRALAKTPEERFQTAEEMSMVLRIWSEDREGDSLGSDLRDSMELFTGDLRDGAGLATPTTGVTVADTGERVKKNLPEKLASEELAEESAPPVQIFSRPGSEPADTADASDESDESDESDDPAVPGPSPTSSPDLPELPERAEPASETAEMASPNTEKRQKKKSVGAPTEETSLTARIVTGIAIAIVLAAIAWTVVTSGESDESAATTDPAAATQSDDGR